MELRPDNWFDAWWLADREREPTRLARDQRDRPVLLGLPADELLLVKAVLRRAWCEGPRDWQAAEWTELQEFEAAAIDRLDALRRGAEDGDSPQACVLAFPPTTHPMFAPGAPGHLLGEAWRLEEHAAFSRWAVAAVSHRDFVARARGNVHLRRIAVEAARRAPGVAVYEVLRRIYREPRSRAGVVAADLEFLARGVGGDAFRSGIADLGLHVASKRSRFPAAKRSRPRSVDPAVAPRITVLIPSYRHESFVAEAVDSCLRQTLPDLRVLVVDDRSPDGTVAAARAVDDPRLTVEVNHENLGLGASVLAALDRIDTPFVALLNSDDVFHPDRLARCLAVLEQDAGAALVATGFAVVDRAGAVLTAATSSPVEIGPHAHGWLRWHEGIVARELHEPADWTSFEVLLRHNVLATSSNMVFRTAWLREHMPEASRLRYCVDWQLFLQAAMEGSLRMIPDSLLAYRLHDANTVWFREGGRTDYVLEVNRVVDRVLGQWFTRTVAGHGPEAAVDRLAALLEGDVGAHGETDGALLYLAGLVHRFAAGAARAETEPLLALTEAALRRKAYGQVIRQLDVAPWSLPWRVQLAERWRLEHEVADGFAARAQALVAARGRLQSELEQTRVEADTLRARHREAEVRHAEVEAAATRAAAAATAERATLQAANATLQAANAALQSDLADRAAALDELRRTRDALAQDLHAAGAEIERWQREAADLRDGFARLDAEATRRGDRVAALEGLVAGMERDLLAVREELSRRAADVETHLRALAVLAGERDDLQRSLAARTQERDGALAEARRQARLKSRATAMAEAERERLAAQSTSPAWRLGDVWARRTGVLGAYKTIAAWWRRGAAAARRGRWHLQRVGSEAGRARAGLVVFVEASDGSMLDERALGRTPFGAGDAPRLVGSPARILRGAVRQAHEIAWLPADARLAAADRAYFARRNPDGVAALDRLFAQGPGLGEAWQAARAAKAMGAGVSVAHGLRGAALASFVTSRLCGIRCVLVLADEDLVDLRIAQDTAREILRAADLVCVDSDTVLRAVERLLDGAPPASIVRWSVAAEASPAPGVQGRSVRIFAEWPGCRRADPATLVAGVEAAVAADLDVTVDVVGGLGDGPAGLERWLRFEDAIECAGLGARFRKHGAVAPAARRALRDAAHVVAWIGRSVDGAGLPRAVLHGLAAGKVILASAVPELLWLPVVAEHVALVEPDHPEAVAAALRSFVQDPEPFTRRARAGRDIMVRRAQDEAVAPLAAVLRARVSP